MVCGPHRTDMIMALYSSSGSTRKELPVKQIAKEVFNQAPAQVQKASYSTLMAAPRGYQGSNGPQPALYGERSTGGMYTIASTPMMSFVQPFKGYQSDQNEIIPTNPRPAIEDRSDLEARLPQREIPRTSYSPNFAYEPVREDVQTSNPPDRSAHELAELLVSARNELLEEKADNIDQMLNAGLYHVH